MWKDVSENTTRLFIPGDGDIHNNRCENLRFYKTTVCQQILLEFLNTEFREYPFDNYRVVSYVQKERQNKWS
jgi:hypothetical protein